jgi:mannitol-1-phosphate 5-dehydrogenase
MTTPPRTFVGFGFGPIQAALFLHEAFRSGNFQRLVVAEVVPELVAAVRRAHGCYRINIATRAGVVVHAVRGLEILNPTVPADAQLLAQALGEASEIATALPSVEFYSKSEPSVAALIAAAVQRKNADPRLPPCIVYTAENHNHAAEILQELCKKSGAPSAPGSVQLLNTVIGKMSGVVSGAEDISAERLACLAEGFPRAFLVEEFNRILISKVQLPNFKRGLEIFLEKPDLLPFEEAKLYGHNAVHACLGYLARLKGYQFLSDAAADRSLMKLAREAFLQESGTALISRHSGLDPLFTPAGYRLYAIDLLGRMTNPFLRDRIDRITRDTPRKLAWNDRLIGTMRLALDAGITPHRFALGAAAALTTLDSAGTAPEQLQKLWPEADTPPGRKAQLIELITEAQSKLKTEEFAHGNI